MSDIEYGVTLGVELLIPKGSCTPDRWLTFEFEAVNGRDSFEWKAQYSTPTGYVNWRTLYGTVPHVKVSDFADARHPYSPWIPEKDFNPEKEGRDRRNGVAPGFVISDGSHDSCWRDNACKLTGYPRIPKNLYKTGGSSWTPPKEGEEGVTRINYETTTWARINNETTINVKKISVSGPVSVAGWLDASEVEKFQDFKEGEWVNDTELTGIWAILHGLSKLSYIVGKESLELRLRGNFSKGKYGTKAHKEGSSCIHYRITNGLVTHRGIPDEKNDWFSKGWEEVEKHGKKPYLLDEIEFRKDAVTSTKSTQFEDQKWELTNLFPDLK